MVGVLNTSGFSKDLSAVNADTQLKDHEPRWRGEQREVTVAFADIRGFTTLADCIPPDELIMVLNAYLTTVVRAFLKYDVEINKFGGDSVMAICNAPTHCENHALLVTKAAIEVQRAVRGLQQRELTLPRINFGIGVNTGRVVVGHIGCEGHLEYSVIGDAVNVAARLTGAVPGGKVWITIGTFEVVKDKITVKSLEPLAMKGKRQPVKVYEVVNVGEDNGNEI